MSKSRYHKCGCHWIDYEGWSLCDEHVALLEKHWGGGRMNLLDKYRQMRNLNEDKAEGYALLAQSILFSYDLDEDLKTDCYAVVEEAKKE